MSSPAYEKVTHVIFDVDGLLLDTETIYEKVVTDILKEFNKPYPRDIRTQVLGRTGDKSAEIIINAMNLPYTIQEYWKKYNDMSKERFLTDLRFLPGAEALVRHLHKHKIPICIGTSSEEDLTSCKVKWNPEFFALFHHKVTGGDDPEVRSGRYRSCYYFSHYKT